jgi:hypothetical protein
MNREQHAIFALLQRTTTAEYAEFKATEAFIPTGTEAKLRRFIAATSDQVARLKKALGMRKTEDLQAIFDDLTGGPPGTLLYVTVGSLLATCRNYREIIPDIEGLPLHTKIGIEDGARRTEPGRYRIYLAELQAFHDLAALHNHAEELGRGLAYEGAQPQIRKTLDALCRSAIVAGYAVIESYLNGLAFDFLLVLPRTLSANEEETLKEVGSNGRPRFVGLRDKLLKYPRIVCGAPAALLDEASCAELAYLLGEPKAIRDAIVHASPNKELIEREPGTPVMLLHVGFDTVLALSKAVVGFLRKIEPAIRGNASRLWWLEDVGADGRFPTNVFE